MSIYVSNIKYFVSTTICILCTSRRKTQKIPEIRTLHIYFIHFFSQKHKIQNFWEYFSKNIPTFNTIWGLLCKTICLFFPKMILNQLIYCNIQNGCHLLIHSYRTLAFIIFISPQIRCFDSKAICQFSLAHSTGFPLIGNPRNHGIRFTCTAQIGGGRKLPMLFQIPKIIHSQLLILFPPIAETIDLICFPFCSQFVCGLVFLLGKDKIRIIFGCCFDFNENRLSMIIKGKNVISRTVTKLVLRLYQP